jgi:hypothetical protein
MSYCIILMPLCANHPKSAGLEGSMNPTLRPPGNRLAFLHFLFFRSRWLFIRPRRPSHPTAQAQEAVTVINAAALHPTRYCHRGAIGCVQQLQDTKQWHLQRDQFAPNHFGGMMSGSMEWLLDSDTPSHKFKSVRADQSCHS